MGGWKGLLLLFNVDESGWPRKRTRYCVGDMKRGLYCNRKVERIDTSFRSLSLSLYLHLADPFGPIGAKVSNPDLADGWKDESNKQKREKYERSKKRSDLVDQTKAKSKKRKRMTKQAAAAAASSASAAVTASR